MCACVQCAEPFARFVYAVGVGNGDSLACFDESDSFWPTREEVEYQIGGALSRWRVNIVTELFFILFFFLLSLAG